MAIRVLKEKDLAILEPVEWNIYDGKGRLLIKKGMKLRSNRQIEKLISLNSFRRTIDGEEGEADKIEIIESTINSALSPFERIEGVLNYLEHLFNRIVYEPANPKNKLPEKLFELSQSIIDLCEYDIDATIGTIHLGQKRDYAIKHPLHCAILCYVLAVEKGINDRRLNTIICAALTSNLGMFELQSGELMKQKGPLTEEQRDEVNKHTMRSAVLLKRIGVLDKLWLEIVLQHHEKIDGTGYPRTLKGKRFIIEARILGLVDRYNAMVAPREYREGMTPTSALKLLFKDRGPEVDADLGSLLIKEMGIYPPGAAVELANKEIAIVTRRGDDRMSPTVKSIYSDGGNLYPAPVAHESSGKVFKITGLSELPANYDFNLYELWDYNLK